MGHRGGGFQNGFIQRVNLFKNYPPPKKKKGFLPFGPKIGSVGRLICFFFFFFKSGHRWYAISFMCVYFWACKTSEWFDPGVGRYCIPLYLGLDNNNCTPSFWWPCVESEVIVLDRCILMRERSTRRKILRSKTITDEFTQWPKQRWCKAIMSLYHLFRAVTIIF